MMSVLIIFTRSTHAIVALFLCCHVFPALASTAAVDETNYTFGLASGDNRTDHGGSSGTIGINAAANFPIINYVGGVLSGIYSKTLLSPYFPSQGSALDKNCGYKDSAVQAGLFVRDPAIGRIGVNDQVGQLSANCDTVFTPSDSRRLDSKMLSVDAEVYLSKLTFAIDRSRTDLEDNAHIETITYGANLYPNRSTRIMLSVGGLDDRNTYSIEAAYQPTLIENVSAFIRFTDQRRPSETRFIYFGFDYYFDTMVDLITRDRQYR